MSIELPPALLETESAAPMAAGSATSAAALFSLPEDADAAASNVAVSSVFRVAEAADFAGVAEGYWEGECKQFCRTY